MERDPFEIMLWYEGVVCLFVCLFVFLEISDCSQIPLKKGLWPTAVFVKPQLRTLGMLYAGYPPIAFPM